MIAADEDALICDFAETYHIYDFRALPATTAAALAAGLPRDSRIFRELSGFELTLTETLLAAGVDILNLLLWSRTKDAESGRNKPKSVLNALADSGDKKENNMRAFDTPEEFMEAYRATLRSIQHGD